MPAINTTKMTASQFLELGEEPPGVHLELVDGEVEIGPNRTPRESHVDRTLGHYLLGHIHIDGLGGLYGDVSVIFDEHNIRWPNVMFFSKNRLHLIGEKAIEGPPDLCVEVVSPSSATIDRKVKFDLYEQAGVAHYTTGSSTPMRGRSRRTR